MNAIPAEHDDGNRAFFALVIEGALGRMKQTVEVIKDIETNGGKIDILKGDTTTKVRDSLNKVADFVETQSTLLRQEIQYYQKELEWGKLCIVMYGPTNSGKSTIIEALSHGDGRTIGTGEKDHTKTPREIPFGPLLLVDTPGIEGGEGELRLRTRKAVRKAHVVVVVTGTGKEPEAGCLTKVAQDADRTGEIFSILNLRGRPTAYNRRACLGSRDTPTLEKRIRLAMSQVFCGRYTEHLSLNAYLAFIAANRVAGLPSVQHQRDRERSAEIFGSMNEAATFSGIGRLFSKFDELILEAQPRVLWGNGFKAITVLGDVSSNFLKAASILDEAAKLWRRLIQNARTGSNSAVKRSRAKVGQTISSRLSSLSNELKANIQEGLDQGLSSTALKHEFQRTVKCAIPDLKNIVEKELNALSEELKLEMDRLHDRMKVGFVVPEFDLPDIDKILQDASLSVEREVFEAFQRIFDAILMSRINLILGILIGIIAVVEKIWKLFLGGKRKRKRKARTAVGRMIDLEMIRVRKKWENTLNEGWDDLGAKVSKLLNYSERLDSGLQSASDSLKEGAIALDIDATVLTTRFLQIDDSVPEGDLLIPVQSSEGDGINLLVHVGKGPWVLPRLPTLPQLCTYPNAGSLLRADCMTREQRKRAYIVAKRMRKSGRKDRTHGKGKFGQIHKGEGAGE